MRKIDPEPEMQPRVVLLLHLGPQVLGKSEAVFILGFRRAVNLLSNGAGGGRGRESITYHFLCSVTHK